MKYIKGNLLDAKTYALVNTVNTVGVMGKGIALQFKEAFPKNYKNYLIACKNKELSPGRLLVVKEDTLSGEKLIINFPTKTEWYLKSQYEYIEEGLKELVNVIKDYKVNSIAIPPLGCGNGGLKWENVKLLMEKYLAKLIDVDIIIYEPNENVKEILKAQQSTKDVNLTPARAMLLYAMFYYESLGENSSLFVANKLAYFLQRLGEKSFKKLIFEQSHFGPYSVQVQHMLHQLNGKYLKGLEQMNVKPFEPLELQYSEAKNLSWFVKTKLSFEQNTTLKNLVKLIDGFQSAYALELLATTDYIRKIEPTANNDDVIKSIQQWSSRKQELFEEKYIHIALNHLDEYKQTLNFS